MLRGNHESRAMTEHFTFRSEILQKFKDEDIYEKFIDSFEAMPIAADVNGDYLCMHGGISPELKSKSDIDSINRFIEPPLHGFLCDLLWSDPERGVEEYGDNDRGVSFTFGENVVKKFIAKHDLDLICRAH